MADVTWAENPFIVRRLRRSIARGAIASKRSVRSLETLAWPAESWANRTALATSHNCSGEFQQAASNCSLAAGESRRSIYSATSVAPSSVAAIGPSPRSNRFTASTSATARRAASGDDFRHASHSAQGSPRAACCDQWRSSSRFGSRMVMTKPGSYSSMFNDARSFCWMRFRVGPMELSGMSSCSLISRYVQPSM